MLWCSFKAAEPKKSQASTLEALAIVSPKPFPDDSSGSALMKDELLSAIALVKSVLQETFSSSLKPFVDQLAEINVSYNQVS